MACRGIFALLTRIDCILIPNYSLLHTQHPVYVGKMELETNGIRKLHMLFFSKREDAGACLTAVIMFVLTVWWGVYM